MSQSFINYTLHNCRTLYNYAILPANHFSCYLATALHCFVSIFQYESDCPSHPTERYTVEVDGVQVADLTADAVQSKITDLSNGFLTLSLPLSQPLPQNAVTLNMTKYNTVPTNRSDVTGNIITEMVTWGTSAVFSELELTARYYEILIL